MMPNSSLKLTRLPPRAAWCERQSTWETIVDVVEDRKLQALAAIKEAFGTEAGEDSVDIFVSHHLTELPVSYWEERCGSGSPEPEVVLGLLELHDSWGEGDVEYFDFTLPGNVTDYQISVHFADTGTIDSISMES